MGGLLVVVLAAYATLAGCGRSHFDALPDGSQEAPDALPDHGIAIRASGSFIGIAELRRVLPTPTSRTRMTVATWYKSSDVGTLWFDAGPAIDRQSYFSGTMTSAPTLGTPILVHQETTTEYAAVPDYGATPWPFSAQWAHVVCSIDLTQTTQVDRVRWWVNGELQPVTEGIRLPYPQDLQLYFGDALPHTFGNKYDGSFDWEGSLAETYVIWDYALDAAAFVAQTQQGLQSIQYTGPITTESLYFNYEVPGQNLLLGQPDWTATGVTSNSDLPY